MQQTAGLLQAIPEPVFSLDEAGRLRESNPAFDALQLGPREIAEAAGHADLVVGRLSYRVAVLGKGGGATYYRLERDADSSGRAPALASYLESLGQGLPPLEAALEALWKGIGWRWSFVTRFNPRMMRQVQVLYCCEHGEAQKPFDYAVQGTPCERVFGDDDAGCRSFSDLEVTFPDDPFIRRVGAKEYVGQIYSTRRDVPLGHLFAISDEPREDCEEAKEVVGLLGHMVSSELQALSWGALVDQATRHANQDGSSTTASETMATAVLYLRSRFRSKYSALGGRAERGSPLR